MGRRSGPAAERRQPAPLADGPGSTQRTFREIMFLQELNNHENIIRCGGRSEALFLPSAPPRPRARLRCRLSARPNTSSTVRCIRTSLAGRRANGAAPGHEELGSFVPSRARARRLLNVLKAENDRDIYLIFEYMETDLHAGSRRPESLLVLPTSCSLGCAFPPQPALSRPSPPPRSHPCEYPRRDPQAIRLLPGPWPLLVAPALGVPLRSSQRPARSRGRPATAPRAAH